MMATLIYQSSILIHQSSVPQTVGWSRAHQCKLIVYGIHSNLLCPHAGKVNKHLSQDDGKLPYLLALTLRTDQGFEAVKLDHFVFSSYENTCMHDFSQGYLEVPSSL